MTILSSALCKTQPRGRARAGAGGSSEMTPQDQTRFLWTLKYRGRSREKRNTFNGKGAGSL